MKRAATGVYRPSSSPLTVFVLSLAALLPRAFCAQEPSIPLLQTMTREARAQYSLSADIVLTWKAHGVERRCSGTVRLMKPNYAIISLSGDYPQRLLISDRQSRFVTTDESAYTQNPIDPTGSKVDSPWWGLPFRFFFTQSLNPFGSPDPKEQFEDLGLQTAADGTVFRVLAAHGQSVMGAYSAKFFFNSHSQVLEKTSVRFGEGEKAAIYEATLTHIRIGRPFTPHDFRFTPSAAQHEASLADTLLSLGNTAPTFDLPSLNGGRIVLSDVLQDKKATLVNFWFYNCAPCRLEFPEFEKLYQQFRSKGFNIVAVDKGDSASTVTNYVQRAGLSFPIALGGDLRKGSVFERYKVTDQFPATYLLDSHGKIVYRTAGADIEGLKRALATLGIQ